MKKAKEPLLLLNLDKPGQPKEIEPKSSPMPSEITGAAAPPSHEKPAFVTLQRRPLLLNDLFRLLLVVLSLVVAGGFVLILLSQPSVDRMTQDLRARHGTPQEKISLLYLGDETKDNEFHIRGVVRNITTSPIEQLDAAVRLFGHDGNVLETSIVRMDKESIAPDETAQFELVYPNYKMEFAKYSVEFKLRDSEVLTYKDMRATR
jgi:hypothetical protein